MIVKPVLTEKEKTAEKSTFGANIFAVNFLLDLLLKFLMLNPSSDEQVQLLDLANRNVCTFHRIPLKVKACSNFL